MMEECRERSKVFSDTEFHLLVYDIGFAIHRVVGSRSGLSFGATCHSRDAGEQGGGDPEEHRGNSNQELEK